VYGGLDSREDLEGQMRAMPGAVGNIKLCEAPRLPAYGKKYYFVGVLCICIYLGLCMQWRLESIFAHGLVRDQIFPMFSSVHKPDQKNLVFRGKFRAPVGF